MNTKLNYIQNWLEQAKQANWSVAKLAEQCKVSVRVLERHFLENMGRTPKAWLAEQRQRQAIELLRDGSSVKETAACLGYKYVTNFTRKYKDHWGTCPTTQMLPTTLVKMTNSAK